MKKFKLKQRLPKILIILSLSTIGLIYLSDLSISQQAKNCFHSIDSIPSAKVGLVLGTSKYVRSGNINQYYQYRLNAARDLYKAKK